MGVHHPTQLNCISFFFIYPFLSLSLLEFHVSVSCIYIILIFTPAPLVSFMPPLKLVASFPLIIIVTQAYT